MKQIDIIEFQEQGYKPLVDFESWRVAILKFCDDLLVENIKSMQKHGETDEVFVLLKGECTLFMGGFLDTVEEIEAIPMEPHKLYVVKKNAWHNHKMTPGSEVLIVENRNTSDDNSPIIPLTPQQIGVLRAL